MSETFRYFLLTLIRTVFEMIAALSLYYFALTTELFQMKKFRNIHIQWYPPIL